MKTAITTIIAGLMLALSVAVPAQAATDDEQALVAAGAATAYIADVVPAVALGSVLVYMLSNSEITQACYSEPLRTVAWKNNPTYTFQVAGCDYQAKKDKFVLK